jgi:hypothetical protein
VMLPHNVDFRRFVENPLNLREGTPSS